MCKSASKRNLSAIPSIAQVNFLSDSSFNFGKWWLACHVGNVPSPWFCWTSPVLAIPSRLVEAAQQKEAIPQGLDWLPGCHYQHCALTVMRVMLFAPQLKEGLRGRVHFDLSTPKGLGVWFLAEYEPVLSNDHSEIKATRREVTKTH